MKTILSIDGGGIRGIIPALVLAKLEELTGRPVCELFDLVAGTSTGGILALGLTHPDADGRPRYRARDMLDLYLQEGARIFPRSLWSGVSSAGGILDEKYPHRPLERVLAERFTDGNLGDALADVLVSAYEIHQRRPFFFKSWDPAHREVRITAIARATSAAPTYFEPAPTEVNGLVYHLVDGGVFVNNPAVSAYAEAVRRHGPEGESEYLVVSLGTGQLTRPIPYEDAKNWGKVGWLLPVLGMVFDGVSSAADYQMAKLLGDNFVRLQVDLKEASDDMDCVTAANLNALQKEAQRLIDANSAPLAALAQRLLQAHPPRDPA